MIDGEAPRFAEERLDSQISGEVHELRQQYPADLRHRTKQFALDIIDLYRAGSGMGATQIVAKQMVRSGTSIGAHYREGHRSRSKAEMISKFELAVQELDETAYWLELLEFCEPGLGQRCTALLHEVDELIAIFVASVRRLKGVSS